MKNVKKLFALVLAVALVFSLAACSGSDDSSAETTAAAAEADSGEDSSAETTADTGSTGAHLDFAVYSYSNSIDPTTNVDSSWCGIRYGVSECLFYFDENVEVEYGLCDSYETEDYQTWTLHIRDGVQFSNGDALTASIVKANLDRLYEKEADGTGNSTPSQYVKFDSIEADDDAGTVTLVCDDVYVNLPGILCYPWYAVIDVDILETADNTPENIIGTGPYYVVEMVEGSHIDEAANPYYWKDDVPYDTVTVVFADDSSTKAMALKSGDVQLAENITTTSDLAELEADDNYYVSVTAGVRLANSYFNYHGVLANDALREAILLAIDDDTICNVTVGGLYTPGCSVVPSSTSYGYEQLTDATPYDVDRAIEVLDEAGIVDTDGDGYRELDGEMIDLNFIASTSRSLDDFAQAVQISLEQIGIKCTVTIQDYDTLLANQNAGNFDIVTSNAITIPTGDPSGFLGNWYSENSDSYGYYSNPEYDAVYEALLSSTDEDERLEYIVELQQILIDDCATMIHGYYNSTFASIASEVTGADIYPMDFYWLTTNIKPAN